MEMSSMWKLFRGALHFKAVGKDLAGIKRMLKVSDTWDKKMIFLLDAIYYDVSCGLKD